MERSDCGVTIRTFKCAKCHVEYHLPQNMEFSPCKEHLEHSYSSVEVNLCSSWRGSRVVFWYWMKFHQFNLKADKEVSLIMLQLNVFFFFLILFFPKIISYICKWALRNNFKAGWAISAFDTDFAQKWGGRGGYVCSVPPQEFFQIAISPTQVGFFCFLEKNVTLQCWYLL